MTNARDVQGQPLWLAGGRVAGRGHKRPSDASCGGAGRAATHCPGTNTSREV